MSRFQQMQDEIAKLDGEELRKRANWIVEERNRRWDEQIEEDVKSGRLDALWAEAQKEILEGKTRPLDEILRD